MRSTKIICTMGPNTDKKTVMKSLVKNGMNVARFNFSHGDHEEQRERMNLLKNVREELDAGPSGGNPPGYERSRNPNRTPGGRKEGNP